MADNVEVTPGSGKIIATDEVGTSHFQKVKSYASTDGTEHPLTRAEDAAASDGDHGIPALAIRRDTAAGPGTDGDYANLITDANGLLRVNASGEAVPITDNSGSITVDNGGTFAVQITGELPAGTQSIGTLGANDGVDIGNVDVTSVVPGTGATSLGKAEDAAHTSGDTGVMMLAVRTATPANRSGADGDYEPPQMSEGKVWVLPRGIQTPNGDSVLDDTANAMKVLLVDASGVAISAGSEYSEGDTDAVIEGLAILWEDTGDTLRAVSAAKPLPVANISVTPGTSAANLGKAEDVAHGSGDTGVALLARRMDTPANSAGASGRYCTVDVSPQGGVWVAPVASVGGGCEAFLSYDLDETEEDVKTTPGTLFGVLVTNTATETRFIKIYNATAANVTVGTTTPKIVVGIPGNATDDIAAVLGLPACGVNFSTAISIAATTDLLDDGSPGAPAANDVAVTVFYK